MVGVAAVVLSGCILVDDPLAGETLDPDPPAASIASSSIGGVPVQIWSPTAGPSVGTVVFAHGGGFSGGDASLVTRAAAETIALGWEIVSVEYTLAPEGAYPTPVDEVVAVVDALSPSADPVVLWGFSAGGPIAALAAADPTVAVDGLVVQAGIWSFDSPSGEEWAASWGGDPPEPAAAVIDEPAYLIHGDADPWVSWPDARSAWIELGAHLDRIENGTHATSLWLNWPALATWLSQR